MADEKTPLAKGVKETVGAGGRSTYTNEAGERVKRDGSPIAKRGEGQAAKKRPAYIVYKATQDGSTGAFTGDFEIVSVSRNAEEVLGSVDADRDLKYKRFEV